MTNDKSAPSERDRLAREHCKDYQPITRPFVICAYMAGYDSRDAAIAAKDARIAELEVKVAKCVSEVKLLEDLMASVARVMNPVTAEWRHHGTVGVVYSNSVANLYGLQLEIEAAIRAAGIK